MPTDLSAPLVPAHGRLADLDAQQDRWRRRILEAEAKGRLDLARRFMAHRLAVQRKIRDIIIPVGGR